MSIKLTPELKNKIDDYFENISEEDFLNACLNAGMKFEIPEIKYPEYDESEPFSDFADKLAKFYGIKKIKPDCILEIYLYSDTKNIGIENFDIINFVSINNKFSTNYLTESNLKETYLFNYNKFIELETLCLYSVEVYYKQIEKNGEIIYYLDLRKFKKK